MASSFKFRMNGVDQRIGKLDDKVLRASFAVMEFYSGKAEAWMKHNAPWNDRTTNARNGLFAQPFHGANHAGITLAHSVDYGIYLELGTKDMYPRPVIIPAIDHWGPRVMKKFSGLINRMK